MARQHAGRYRRNLKSICGKHTLLVQWGEVVAPNHVATRLVHPRYAMKRLDLLPLFLRTENFCHNPPIAATALIPIQRLPDCAPKRLRFWGSSVVFSCSWMARGTRRKTAYPPLPCLQQTLAGLISKGLQTSLPVGVIPLPGELQVPRALLHAWLGDNTSVTHSALRQKLRSRHPSFRSVTLKLVRLFGEAAGAS